MGRQHVGQMEITAFAAERVNLPKEIADRHRAQARRLREQLEIYLYQHPDFSLRKMMIAGSLAKGTALRTINDIDVACYIEGDCAPHRVADLIDYLAERLRKAFPNFTADQVQPQTYSVTVNFKGSGLNVDVVPILYDGDPDWHGDLVSQDDGSFLRTSIPRHLAFTKSRKDAQPKHFAQVVRLAKFWARRMKQERDGFRFKSFMVEMVVAKITDRGTDLSDYPEALQAFFTYIATSDLREVIAFGDYYPKSSVPACGDPVRIIDPVNAANNVARLYDRAQADMIVDAALEAGDAIDSALAAPTKQETVRYWQKVFGPAFQP